MSLEWYVRKVLRHQARSAFTKSGPGVASRLRWTIANFLPRQDMREILVRKGWDRGVLKRCPSGRLVLSREKS